MQGRHIGVDHNLELIKINVEYLARHFRLGTDDTERFAVRRGPALGPC